MSNVRKCAVAASLGLLLVAWGCGDKDPAPTVSRESAPAEPQANAVPLPHLMDLGSVSCVPCKMMAPILEELKKEYAGRLRVTFIDVNKDKAPATKYGIRLIPTQIFFDATGKELFRHEGFFSKEDILKKWKELGVDLGAAPGKTAAS